MGGDFSGFFHWGRGVYWCEVISIFEFLLGSSMFNIERVKSYQKSFLMFISLKGPTSKNK